MSITDGFEDFVAILDHGSISAAARATGVPRPTLSRRLADLEAALGVRLVHRSTRSLTLTAAGQALLPRARQIVADARAAHAEVARLDDVPRGLLRLTVPPPTPEGAFMGPMIQAWLAANPDVRAEVLSTTRAVDLAAEGFDVALRGGTVRASNLISRTLFRTTSVAVARPDLFGGSAPTEPGDLATLPCVLGLGPGDVPQRSWPLRAGGAVTVDGRLATNDLVIRRAAALDGAGVTLLPERLVRDELARGDLVAVLPDLVGADAALRLVYIERAFLDPKVRSFVDHVVAWINAMEAASGASAAGRG